MQRAKRQNDGIFEVPSLPKGHYFVTFNEEFWNTQEEPKWRVGRIEVFEKGEIYSQRELRWCYENTEYWIRSFDVFREYWDFINVTPRELARLEEELKFFQDPSA